LIQFPTAFEFNENLLVFLADHIHSGLFGNFLGDNEKYRTIDLKVRETTQSLWSYVFHPTKVSFFQNHSFSPLDHPIWPSSSQHSIRIWERYYFRWDPSLHPNKTTQTDWKCDWGNPTANVFFEGEEKEEMK